MKHSTTFSLFLVVNKALRFRKQSPKCCLTPIALAIALLTRPHPVEPCSQPKKNVEILLVVVVAMVIHAPDCMKPPPSNAILVAVRAMSSETVERSRTATRNELILPKMTPK
mmetsp:Transcript_26330/g.51875  ORF Transcript_26330/g.51875 Transcript_26330/m.51875 type:complete len:112 (+) Transcript_26330:81-416(+)